MTIWFELKESKHNDKKRNEKKSFAPKVKTVSIIYSLN